MMVQLDLEGAGRSEIIRVDEIGVKVCRVLNEDGMFVGVFTMKTIGGGEFSRIIVRIGRVRVRLAEEGAKKIEGALEFCEVHARFKLAQLQCTLWRLGKHELEEEDNPNERDAASDLFNLPEPPVQKKTAAAKDKKNERKSNGRRMEALLRCIVTNVECEFRKHLILDKRRQRQEFNEVQVMVHSITLLDMNVSSPYPIVIDAGSRDSNFVAFICRWRGNDGSVGGFFTGVDLIKCDVLCDGKGKPRGVVKIATHEGFVWEVVELYSTLAENLVEGLDENEGILKYCGGVRGEKIYLFKLCLISKINLNVTFKRKAKANGAAVNKTDDRFEGEGGVIDYLTKQLKFTIEDCLLEFKDVKKKNIKGGFETLAETIVIIYVKRARSKWLTLASAVSLNDWKKLSGREGGGDDFEEGDLFRTVGNVFVGGGGRALGKGIGNVAKEFSDGVNVIGDGLEELTGKIGLGDIGKGVNNVVGGAADGFGGFVGGIGAGGAQFVGGAGKGLGQVAGGFGGGVSKIGKGVFKGIAKGDGEALVEGIGGGLESIGSGILDGGESVITGIGDGIFSFGKGLFGGVKSVGGGIGDAFKGKDKKRRN